MKNSHHLPITSTTEILSPQRAMSCGGLTPTWEAAALTQRLPPSPPTLQPQTLQALFEIRCLYLQKSNSPILLCWIRGIILRI